MRLILYAILAFVIYYLFKGLSGKGTQMPRRRSEQPPEAGKELKMDPVCGTYIPEDTPYRLRHKGTTHYFCSEECLKTYKKQIAEGKTE